VLHQVGVSFDLVFLHCGIPNVHKFQLHKQKYIGLYKLNLLCDGFKLKLETYIYGGTLKSLHIKDNIELVIYFFKILRTRQYFNPNPANVEKMVSS